MSKADRPAVRRKNLVRRFRAEGIDGLLLTDCRNIFYLSGFRGDDSALLVTRDDAFLITDSRFEEEAAEMVRGIHLVVRKRHGLMRTCAETARKAGVGRLGVEAKDITLTQADELDKCRRKMGIHKTRDVVENLRLIKDASELAAIRKALKIAEEGFRLTLAAIGPGMSERDAALHLDRTMQDLGAQESAFPTICAAGSRASLPHAMPTTRKIRKGEPVLFDWGARCDMYHSDLTRLACWDRIPPTFSRIYGILLAAQRRAIAAVRPGRRAADVDESARASLRAHRFGKRFGHGLGHGVGLAIHEAPILGPKQDALLRPGMVMTIEPGVYFPGRGGVRIEDVVLVTHTGCKVLSSAPKTLTSCLVRA